MQAICPSYLHDHSCPWSDHACEVLAMNGNLECLIFAHENGCPWDSRTCTTAAQTGHLSCLQYAHTNGCPWDEKTTRAAYDTAHFECFYYAIEQNCPVNELGGKKRVPVLCCMLCSTARMCLQLNFGVKPCLFVCMNLLTSQCSALDGSWCLSSQFCSGW